MFDLKKQLLFRKDKKIRDEQEIHSTSSEPQKHPSDQVGSKKIKKVQGTHPDDCISNESELRNDNNICSLIESYFDKDVKRSVSGNLLKRKKTLQEQQEFSRERAHDLVVMYESSQDPELLALNKEVIKVTSKIAGIQKFVTNKKSGSEDSLHEDKENGTRHNLTISVRSAKSSVQEKAMNSIAKKRSTIVETQVNMKRAHIPPKMTKSFSFKKGQDFATLRSQKLHEEVEKNREYFELNKGMQLKKKASSYTGSPSLTITSPREAMQRYQERIEESQSLQKQLLFDPNSISSEKSKRNFNYTWRSKSKLLSGKENNSIVYDLPTVC